MLETAERSDSGVTLKPSFAGDAEPMSGTEWQARVELAALYRITNVMGWDEITSTHITMRVPDEPDCFLINPHGLRYDEIKASNLVKIDEEGHLRAPSDYGVNIPGFIIHGAVHMARPDVACVMHTHTIADNAVSAMECGLLALNQTSALIYGLVGYHDFEGLAVNFEERERLARDLGDKPLMMLRNHGMLAVGESASHAFMNAYYFQRSCQMQVATLSCNMPYREVPHAIGVASAEGFEKFARARPCYDWEAMIRKIDALDPSYRE
ncbi:MAG: class II aldolase/adducin family protein [Sphingomonadales bacterium]|nr:MAG: class II aldolase/adducin family protein [Sphingomonadales bacterium]